MRHVAVSLPLALAVACSNPVKVPDDALRVRRVPAGLERLNASRTPLGYLVFARNLQVEIDWNLCACPTVGAHATVFVPDSAIAGFTQDSREAVLHWWPRAVDCPSSSLGNSMHQLVVSLSDFAGVPN